MQTCLSVPFGNPFHSTAVGLVALTSGTASKYVALGAWITKKSKGTWWYGETSQPKTPQPFLLAIFAMASKYSPENSDATCSSVIPRGGKTKNVLVHVPIEWTMKTGLV